VDVVGQKVTARFVGEQQPATAAVQRIVVVVLKEGVQIVYVWRAVERGVSWWSSTTANTSSHGPISPSVVEFMGAILLRQKTGS
jgi:uncharacterized protein (DUF1800 family)